MVDRHRSAPRNRPCKRDGAWAHCSNITSRGRRNVNTPVPFVATDRGERGDDHHIERKCQPMAGTSGRDHRKDQRERGQRLQHVSTPPPQQQHTASDPQRLVVRRAPSVSYVDISPTP
jgi:hypothetical protein